MEKTGGIWPNMRELQFASAAKPWSSATPEPALPRLGTDMDLLLLLHGPRGVPLQHGLSSPARLPRLPGMSSPAAGVAPMGTGPSLQIRGAQCA